MAHDLATQGGRVKPPPLKTSLDSSWPPQDGSASSSKPRTSVEYDRRPEDHDLQLPVKPGHQNFVLTDPVAFRYLEEDSSTTVIDKRRPLQGYECYLVEQWTTSRTHPTFMITTYTGDPSSSVMVGVLSVPTDEDIWSPRLRVYFRALNQYHARRRQTPLGILMVTNLSNFPSSLTVIPVPNGDIKSHRFDFFLNENLKRLGCSGRVGLTLAQPAAATVAKFHQLYRTSEKNDVYKSVIELVKLCQTALTLFDKLEIDYADGLLCDVTERAVNDWWADIGYEQYNVEPHDGILGPTTVAGLLGLLMGARNRLHAMNAPVPKEPFDMEGMKKGISAFQKQQRMQRTRRLDRRTLERLHKATQKAADKDRWAVPKAVKSTMAELSGKGGEMVLDVVGRRDRAGIAEIESVDIDRFVQLVYGDRAKWLWLGKPIKKQKADDGQDRSPDDVQGDPSLHQGLIFKSDEHGGFTWAAARKSTVDGLGDSKREQQRRDREYEEFNKPTPTTTEELEENGEEGRSSMFKRATIIKDEAKSGLGKVKGAVGLRGHKTKPSTDETRQASPTAQEPSKNRRPLLRRALSSPVSSPTSPKVDNGEDRVMPSVAEHSNILNMALATESSEPMGSKSIIGSSEDQRLSLPPGAKEFCQENGDSRVFDEHLAPQTATATASPAESIYNGIDLNEALPNGPQTELDPHSLLRRTLSYSQFIDIQLESHADQAYPRQLSFSLAEESVLEWEPLATSLADTFHDDLKSQLAAQKLHTKETKHLRSLLATLRTQTATWTSSKINLLQDVLRQLDQDQETLESLHEPRIQSVRELQVHSESMSQNQRGRFEESVKEIEAVGAKLEYEIDGLKSRVEEVAAAVTDFEKGVVRVEDRVVELEREGQKPVWRCVLQ